MKQIDLDDLPPRAAQILTGLEEGEELVLVQGGCLKARLLVSHPVAGSEPQTNLTTVEAMEEVLDHFKSMVEDEF